MATFGKYELVRKLAQGGMAEVFLAHAVGPMGFTKQVVVKRILPGLAENDEFVTLFLNEARLAGQLNHANVVQLFDMGREEGSYYLAMEYLDGPNLRDLKQGAKAAGELLPVPVVVKVLSLACEGLAYAHEYVDPNGTPLNLVHRDISPHNILTSRGGNVKVADFGIARAATIPSITKTGKIRGKLKYMSPEQLRDEPLDKRSDVWALGVTFYELLTGARPFEAPTEAGVINAILAQAPTPLAQVRPDAPAALQPIVERALAKECGQRYPDCRALQADLEAALISLGEVVRGLEVAQVIARLCPADAPAQSARPVTDPRRPAARPTSEAPLPAAPPAAPALTHAARPRALSHPEVPPAEAPITATEPDAPGGPLPTRTAPTRTMSDEVSAPLAPDELTPTGDQAPAPAGLVTRVSRHPVLAGLALGLLAVAALLALAWWSRQSQARLDALTQQAQRPLPLAPHHLAVDETQVQASASVPVEEPTLQRASPVVAVEPVQAEAPASASGGGGGGGPSKGHGAKDLPGFAKGKLLTPSRAANRSGSDDDDPGLAGDAPLPVGPAFGRRQAQLPYGTLVVKLLTPAQVDVDDMQYGFQERNQDLTLALEVGEHLVRVWRRNGWSQSMKVTIYSNQERTLSF